MRHVIDLQRLRAAYHASGVSYNQLATRGGMSHTTISRWFKEEHAQRRVGKPPRVVLNPASLEGIAEALRVPPEWLTGELASLPFVPRHGPVSDKFADSPETIDAAKVRLSHLLTGVHTALQRDLQDWYGVASDEAYRSWGTGILLAVQELSWPSLWRTAMIVPLDGDPGAYLSKDIFDNSAPVSWLEQALEPWFAGRALLNAAALSKTCQTLFADPTVAYQPSQIVREDIERALGMYDVSATGHRLRGSDGRRARRRRGRP